MPDPGEYAVDVVLCVDVTGSMYPIVDRLKAGALTFHKRLQESAAARDKVLGDLRVRVVAYRDFRDDPVDALLESRFFTMPGQVGEFDSVLRDLQAGGGGDEPESGLEALAVALDSDWARGSDRRRHIVVLLTDASAHPLGVGGTAAGYPVSVPSTIGGLTEAWRLRDRECSRLLLFAPPMAPWTEIAAGWPNTVSRPSRAGGGLHEFALGDIVEATAGVI
ncbi:MAG TPA: vWA domain-containing protein [Actinoplanes sp.]|nr:vWA domain-containing protein [Actinoplanes sp.]